MTIRVGLSLAAGLAAGCATPERIAPLPFVAAAALSGPEARAIGSRDGAAPWVPTYRERAFGPQPDAGFRAADGGPAAAGPYLRPLLASAEPEAVRAPAGTTTGTAAIGPATETVGPATAAAAAPGPATAPASAPSAAVRARIARLKDLSLEDLMEVKVSTLSRVDERGDLAPGSVYVYPRDVIRTRGYRSLGELLQVVPGFTVFHRDLDYVVGVRGLTANDNDKVSLLINGQNLNGPHEQSFLNGPINLDSAERVEVVVGPSSLFQQANTLAATINVITRDVEGFEFVSGLGTDTRYSETIMAGHRFEPDKYLGFSVTTEEKKGFRAWREDFSLGQPGDDLTGALDQPSYFGIVKGQIGELTAQFTAYRSNWPELHIDNGDPANHGTMTQEWYSFFAKADHAFSPTLTGVLRVEATYKSQTRLNEDGPPINAVQQAVHQRYYSAEAGLRYTGFERHFIQGGVQASFTDNFDNYFTFLAPGQPGAIPKTQLFNEDTYAVGVYVEDEYKVAEKWKLVGGLRADYNSKLSPREWFPGGRAAVVYEPKPNWVTKLMYSRAVRMPSDLQALNQVWGANNPGAPEFADTSLTARDPEVLSTVEWQNIFYVGKVRIGTSIYHEEMQDFITWFSPHSNGGNFRGNGVEVSVQAPIRQGLSFWANGAWNDSVLHLSNADLFGANPQSGGGVSTESIHAYVNPDDRIIGSAEYTANVGVDLEVLPNVILSPAVRYFTNQAAVRNNNEYVIIRNRFYLDAALSWNKIGGKELDLRFSAYNILNNRDEVGSPLNGDTYNPRGVSFFLSLDARF